MKRIYLLSLTVFAMGVLNAQHAPTFKKIPAELASQTVQIKGNPSTLQNQNKAPQSRFCQKTKLTLASDPFWPLLNFESNCDSAGWLGANTY